ncbi:MAG: hypothetical protein NT154_36135 [Verrucomicrobia bacterium]|nr:hypothetical protein [Verrucomicrobiota bacterium]
MKTITTCYRLNACLYFSTFLAADAIAPQVAWSQEAPRTMETIPVIQMEHVPLTDAIKNLARQASLNYILDPRVSDPWVGADGKSAREPSVTGRWENVTAEQALGRLLKEHGLTIVANPATSIARIAFTNQAVKPLPASPAGIGTNTIIPLIVMDSVPLPDAIKNLARPAHLDLSLDPALPVPFAGPVTRTVSKCVISLRWENVTARQAIDALLDNYGLVLVLDPVTSSAKILAKEPTQSGTQPK